jgi:hypothetical protein
VNADAHLFAPGGALSRPTQMVTDPRPRYLDRAHAAKVEMWMDMEYAESERRAGATESATASNEPNLAWI